MLLLLMSEIITDIQQYLKYLYLLVLFNTNIQHFLHFTLTRFWQELQFYHVCFKSYFLLHLLGLKKWPNIIWALWDSIHILGNPHKLGFWAQPRGRGGPEGVQMPNTFNRFSFIAWNWSKFSKTKHHFEVILYQNNKC